MKNEGKIKIESEKQMLFKMQNLLVMYKNVSYKFSCCVQSQKLM